MKKGVSMKNKKIKKIISLMGICLGIGIIAVCLFLLNKKPEVVYQEKVVYKKEKTKTLSDIKKNENIVFLGDSITDFYPIDSIYLDLPIIKSGISGYTTNDILDRMDTMVYQYNPTSVFLLIGTNDIMHDPESNKGITVENIEKIVENIKKNRKKAKIYLESIYPVNKMVNPRMVYNRENSVIQEMNAKLKDYCDSNENVIYIDMNKELQDENGNFDAKYTNDGLHPNDLGYAKISQVRLTYILDIDK